MLGYRPPLMTRPSDLEPAVRDPKKLARTAWILVAMMLLGGWLVLKAYEKWAAQQAGDDRPAIIYRIPKEKDLRVVRQDGKTADLFDLRGNVWVVNVISLTHPEASALSLAVMKRLSEEYLDTPDFSLVTLAVNPMPADKIVGALSNAADTHGMELPRWWLGGNEPETLHTFIKNELKASEFPHLAEDQWVFDSSIVLIDRNGHIRRAVVPQKQGGPPFIATFDFEQAAKWDSEGKKTGTDRSNQEELESLLEATIDTLLTEATEES